MNKALAALPTVKATKRQTELVRSRIAQQAHGVAQRVLACINGEIELTPVQAQLCKLVLDKTVPNLQSIDASITDESPTMSEAQAVERLALLLSRHPELADVLRTRGVTVDAPQEAPVVDAGAEERTDSESTDT